MDRKVLRAVPVIGYVMTSILLPMILILGQDQFESAYPVAVFWLFLLVCSSVCGFLHFSRRPGLMMQATLFNQ
jgi:hypothetical protein